MKKKHVMFILLVCIIGISVLSSVSASDLNETIASEIDEEDISIDEIEENHENKLSRIETSEIISANYTPKTSSEIQSCIDNAQNGDTIIFDGYYLINSTVNVGKNLNFIGINDATIDGNDIVGLFSVSENSVTFNNITFKNGNSTFGGAIYFNGGGSVVNCSFVGNSAFYYGGAVYIVGGSVVNCSFVNNSARYGGAIQIFGGGSVVNCSFVNNSAGDYTGGAIQVIGGGSVVNCSFVNNSANYGGAVYGGGCYVVNSSFVGNSANYGGAVYYSGDGSVVNSSFVGNSANDGGAVYLRGGSSVVNCSFVNNSVSDYSGGAVYFSGGGSVVNCSFVGNSANYGGAVYFSGGGSVVNCSFVNNSDLNGGGAIYSLRDCFVYCCAFENCSSIQGGSYLWFDSTYLILNCEFDIPPEALNYYYETFLNVNNLTVVKGQNIFLEVNLYDYNGNPLNNKTITFNINGIQQNKTTSFDGSLIFNIKNYLTESGIYYINVSFAGEDHIYKSSAVSRVVIKYDPILNVKEVVVVQGEDGFLKVNLSNAQGPLVNKTIKFNIKGNYYQNTTDENGSTFINVKDYLTDIGSYPVTISFDGDEFNNLASVNTNVIINKSNSNLEVNNLSIFKGENGWLFAHLFDGNGPLVGKIITFNLNGIKYNSTTNASGVAKVNVKDYLTVAGNYSVGVRFAGDELKNPVSTSAQVVINKYSPSLSVNNLISVLDDDGFLVANISDSRGRLYNKKIVFTINENKYVESTNYDGSATFNIKNRISDVGNYVIGVTFEGDEYDNPVSTSSNVIVKYNSSLKVNELIVFKGEDGWLNVNLTNHHGGPLAYKDIILVINGSEHIETTSYYGLVKLNVKDYLTVAGEYIIGVRFDGDEFANPISTSTNVVINKYTPILAVNDLSIVLGNDGVIVASLSDARGVLANKAVKFMINGIAYTNSTDSNGVARFNVKDYITAVGSFDVNVSFAGDDFDKLVSANSNVVIKYDPVLNMENLTMFKGQDGFLVATLINPSGALFNKTLTFTINGNEHDEITENDGVARINLKNYLTDVGEYDVSVRFAGDEFNIPVVKNATVNVVLSNSNLSVNNLSIVLGDEGTLTANLSDNKGPLVNKIVTFTVNGNNYQNTTDINGLANFKITDYVKNYGEYDIDVSFAGDEFANPINARSSVRINIYQGTLTINQSGKYYGNTNLTFKLVNSRTNVSISDVLVDVVFSNNVTLRNITDANGIFTYEVPFAPGYYDVIASVSIPYVDIKTAYLNNFLVSKFIGEVEVKQTEEPRILTVKLFNHDNGDVFENFTVTLRIEHEGKFSYFDVMTGKDGVCNFTIESSSGIYSVHAFVEGQYMEFTPFDLYNIIVNNNRNSEISLSNTLLVFNYTGSDSIWLTVKGGNVNKENITVNSDDAVIDFKNNIITVSGLDAGNYTLYVASTPNDGYNSVTVTARIIVNKIDTTVDFYGQLVFDYDSSGNNYVNVNGGNISLSNISVDGQPDAVIDYKNNQITVSGLDAGNYTLRVKTTPDKNHLSVDATAPITVNKINSIIELSNEVTFDYKGIGYINVTTNGGSVDLTNISVEGQSEAIIDIENNIISVSGLDAGSYTLHVKTTPDENHISVEGTVSITVNKIDSIIEFNKQNITYNYGKIGSVKVSVDGGVIDKIYVIDYSEAEIYCEDDLIFISNLKAGEYTLYVNSKPDKNHNSVSNTIGIVVESIESEVEFSGNLSFDYGQSDSTFVYVKGGSVDLANISVIGHPEAKITFNNNIITVSNLSAGNYTLKAISTPDQDHISSFGTAFITVNKINSQVSFSGNISFAYGMSDSTFVIVTGGVVGNVSVEGHPEANITSDNNKITLSGLDVGYYTLRVISVPDNNHLSVENNLPVSVSKSDSKVIFENEITFDYGGVGFTSLSVEGGSIDYENIFVDGHPEAIWSVSNRVVSISNLTAGNYTLCVGTIPDGNHNQVIGNIQITVNKISSKLSLPSSLTFAYLQSASTFVSVDGGSVSLDSFDVLGHKEAKITFSNNFVSISNLNPGKYTLRVTSNPDGNHISTTNYVGITVNRANAAIKVSSKTVALKKSTLWTVQVTANGKGIAGIDVVLKVFTGKKYRTVVVKTDANGVASFNTKRLSKGSHKVVAGISHIGYVALEASATIKVIKQTKLNFKVKKNVAKDGSSLSITVKKGKKRMNGVKIKLLIYTGKKLTRTVALKTKKNGKYNGVCGWGTNKLTAGTHKIVIKPAKLKFSGSKTVNLKITKAALKHPKWETKI